MGFIAWAGVVGLLAGLSLLRRRACTWCGAPLPARHLAEHFFAAHAHEPATTPPVGAGIT